MKVPKLDVKLDEYEQQVEDSLDRGEWTSQLTEERKKELQESAQATVEERNKRQRVNVRLSARDLADLKAQAALEGMPYQTLLSSILHRYLNGTLVEAADSRVRERRAA